MCGGGQRREKVRAENEQKRLNKIAEKRQEELDRLSEQRMTVAQQQQAQSVALQAQYAEEEAFQTTKVAGMKAEQAAKVKGIQTAADTVSNSLRAMAGQSPPTAPTAAVTKKKTKSRSPRQTGSSLTIGSTANSAGSGSNLSI